MYRMHSAQLCQKGLPSKPTSLQIFNRIPQCRPQAYNFAKNRLESAAPPSERPQREKPYCGGRVENALTDPINAKRSCDLEDNKTPKHPGHCSAEYQRKTVRVAPVKTRYPPPRKAKSENGPAESSGQSYHNWDVGERTAPPSNQEEYCPDKPHRTKNHTNDPRWRSGMRVGTAPSWPSRRQRMRAEDEQHNGSNPIDYVERRRTVRQH